MQFKKNMLCNLKRMDLASQMKVKKTIEKIAQLAFYLVLIRKQVGSPS